MGESPRNLHPKVVSYARHVSSMKEDFQPLSQYQQRIQNKYMQLVSRLDEQDSRNQDMKMLQNEHQT